MTSAPPSEGDYSHLSRRLLQFAGVLAVLLIVTVAFAWLHGGNEASFNPIAQAAARTQGSPGGRTSFHAIVRGDSQPHPVAISGAGVFNSQTNRSQLTMTVPTPAGEVEMEGIGSGSQMYFKSKLLQPGLPSGDEWMGIDASLGSASETSFAANSDPAAQLDLLRAVSDEFETLGKKEIGGTETTGYRSTFDLDGYAEYLRGRGSEKAAEQYERIAEAVPSNTEVVTWIDAEGLVRQTRMTGESEDPNSGVRISTEVTMDFYDFGITPDIQLPDPDTVYDATPTIRAKLGLDSSS